MTVGALVLPEVIVGIIEGIDDTQPVNPSHAQASFNHRFRIVGTPICSATG